MNILEAIKYTKIGYKITRGNNLVVYNLDDTLYRDLNDSYVHYYPSFSDLTANDWKVLECNHANRSIIKPFNNYTAASIL